MCIIPIGIDVERHTRRARSVLTTRRIFSHRANAGLLPRIWSLIVASLIALLVAGDSLTAKARWATISWVIRTDPGRAIAGLALGRRNYETGAWKMHADLADGGIAASEDDLVDV